MWVETLCALLPAHVELVGGTEGGRMAFQHVAGQPEVVVELEVVAGDELAHA